MGREGVSDRPSPNTADFMLWFSLIVRAGRLTGDGGEGSAAGEGASTTRRWQLQSPEVTQDHKIGTTPVVWFQAGLPPPASAVAQSDSVAGVFSPDQESEAPGEVHGGQHDG